MSLHMCSLLVVMLQVLAIIRILIKSILDDSYKAESFLIKEKLHGCFYH